MKRRWLVLGFLLIALVGLVAAGCGGDDDTAEPAPPAEEPAPEPPAEEPAPEPPAEEPAAPAEPPAAEPPAEEPSAMEDLTGDISLMGIWVGEEQESIEAVLDGFRAIYPNVNVTYDAAGDDLPTILTTAIEGGNPPDLAAIAQPGFIAELVASGDAIPLVEVQGVVVENFGESVVAIGTFEDAFYAIPMKSVNKAMAWYNVASFDAAGVEPPTTWDELLATAETLKASGIPAYSLAAADGWTLTDLFENIYIRTAGPEAYDLLSRHEIPWTDQTVKDALTFMAGVVGDSDNLAGGTDGALQTGFADSVARVLTEDPEAAIVIEGDFVPGQVETTLTFPDGYNLFPFPSIAGSPGSIVTAGDFVVMFRDSPAAQALAAYLASPEAASIWAARGGFLSLNKKVDPSVYPDPVIQEAAAAIAASEVVRFDLSDLQPGAFGATTGQGLWKLFQDFVENPDDIDAITEQMEAEASAAFGG